MILSRQPIYIYVENSLSLGHVCENLQCEDVDENGGLNIVEKEELGSSPNNKRVSGND